jgi:hypothetical protein
MVQDLRLGAVAIIDAAAGVLQSSYGSASLRDKLLSPGARACLTCLKGVEAEMQTMAGGVDRAARRSAAPRRQLEPNCQWAAEC